MGLVPFLVGAPLPAQAVTVIPNVNVSQTPGNQEETAVAVDPVNPQKVFIVSNNDAGGLMLAFSGDAGATWNHRIGANGSDGLPSACCDASVSWDTFGNLFLVYLDANVGSGAVHVLLSTDGGQTFTPIASLDSGQSDDQPTVTTGAGSVWATWTDGSDRVSAAGAKVSGLGAANVGAFSATEHAGNGDFGDIAISPTGAVMVTYQRPHNGTAPSTLYTALDPDGLGPAGFNAESAVVTVNMSGFYPIPAQSARTIDPEPGLAWDRSGGAHNGRVYFMYTDTPSVGSADTNVFVIFSDDSGATWSSPVRVNDDTGTNSQFLPKISLDQTTGRIAVTWHDARNSPTNTSAQFWGATSADGTAFSTNFQISTGSSTASTSGSIIDFGDYTGLSYQEGVLYPTWADNSNSTGDNPNGANSAFDVYTAGVVEHRRPTALVYNGDTTGVFNQAATLAATLTDATAGSPVAGKPVQLTLGSQGCSATTDANGHASCAVTITQAAGTTTATATFAGDTIYAPSSASHGFVISREPTTTTLTSSANPSAFGQAVTFTATVAPSPPGGATPTGTVAFSADGGSLGAPAALSGGHASSGPISSLGPGSHTISAAYSGDPGFLPSSASLVQVVTCTVTITGQFNGTLTVTTATCITNAMVNGNISVQPGASVAMTQSTLNGTFNANGATGIRFCGDTLHGPLTFTNSSGQVLLGDAGDDVTACAGNLSDGGAVLMTNNHGGAEIGGNTIFGNITLDGTSGSNGIAEDAAPEIEANHVQGTLTCSGNSPAPTNDGRPNTVSGFKSGQCAGSGF